MLLAVSSVHAVLLCLLLLIVQDFADTEKRILEEAMVGKLAQRSDVSDVLQSALSSMWRCFKISNQDC